MDPEGDRRGPLAGQTLGAYRVVEQIGAGGMGVVYLAIHDRLGRRVAVKALPADAPSDSEARRDLLREARRASRVVHPYVATVFDVIEHEGSAFIVMEYIEGRTLDRVLQEDRPDSRRVLEYAIEIAEALAAIHGAGLIHRDLKPGNVMVTASGHVKVMDFGVAQENLSVLRSSDGGRSTGSTVSHDVARRMAGTVVYMSPEQLRGAALDPRSDLFSFGIVLWEASTRRHPFVRETTLATASAILTDPPGVGDPLPPRIEDERLSAIAVRLLEKEKDRRYPDAEALLRDLRSVKEERASEHDRAPSWVAGRHRLWLVAAAAVVTASVLGFLVWKGVHAPRSPGVLKDVRPVLAVLPFEDRTGSADGDSLRGMIADLLAADLGGSSRVRALSSERVQQILSALPAHTPAARARAKIAEAAHVKWIVAGALYKEGESFQAAVEVYGSDAPDAVATFRAAAGSAATLPDRIVGNLRETLFREPSGNQEDLTPAPGASPHSDEAGMLEQDARKAARESQFKRAIELLERAVKLDSTFLPAQIRLAEALDLAGYGDRAREVAERALRDVERPGAAGGRLALEVRAMNARVHDDVAAEIEARRSLVQRRGDDPALHLALAQALLRAGKSADALSEADLAVALDPQDPQPRLVKARALSDQQRYDDALASLEQADRLFAALGSGSGRAIVTKSRGDVEFARAHYREAGRNYRVAARELRAAGLEMAAAGATKAAADIDVLLGDEKSAEADYGSVLAAARAAGSHRLEVNTLDSLGALYHRRGELDKAERILEEALDPRVSLRDPKSVVGPTLNLASVLSDAGREEDSRTLMEKGLGMARAAGNLEAQAMALVLLAGVDVSRGHITDAIRSYREILDSKDLASAPTTKLGDVYQGLAEALQVTGSSGEALSAIDRGVEIDRASGDRVALGYGLAVRASLRAELVLLDQAGKDVAEARAIAAAQGGKQEGLGLGIDLAAGRVAAAAGRWSEAESFLAGARATSAHSSTSGLEAEAFAASCDAALGAGRVEDALGFCRRAVEMRDADPSTRAAARAAWAEALAASGNAVLAESEARRAGDEAETMGLPLVAARAAAVLLRLPAVSAEARAVRERGRAALAKYLDGVPPERRTAVRGRATLSSMIHELESQDSAARGSAVGR